MLKKQARTGSAVPVLLQRHTGVPLTQQLAQRLREQIHAGTLPAGFIMPATRILAQDLAVARSVVVHAYEQLQAEGYLSTTPRLATRVTALPAAPPRPAAPSAARSAPVLQWDLRPGVPDTRLFPRSRWATAVRLALHTTPAALLGYDHVQGIPPLREALAAYLRRVRSLNVAPDQILICAGFAQGIGLISRVLRQRGQTRVAIEDPCHPAFATFLAHQGVEVCPVPVDDEGVGLAALTRSGARAVVVTPAHQFPLGLSDSPIRRLALRDWAHACDGVIIEDDYDAEYRYDHAPIGALQGLAPDHVLYIGSLSKMVAPGLRLGWVVMPPSWCDELLQMKAMTDLGSPVLEQLALCQLMETGGFERHVRQLRGIYRHRRDQWMQVLHRLPRPVTIAGIAAGLHLLAFLPGHLREGDLIAAARARGLGLYGLGSYSQGQPRPPALVLGYAAFTESELGEIGRQLAELLHAMAL